MGKRLVQFIKKDTVLFAAVVLAVLSAFFVKPSVNYINYIDFRVLGILFCLMTVMAGLQKNGLFDRIGSSLLRRTKNTMQLALVLIFLCFFFSMLITNDVSLITFVPFAMVTLQKCGQEKLLLPVIVLQTLAANLGSMLTPVGNPQNLYLYNLAEMGIGEFAMVLLPYTIISGVLIFLSVWFICRKKEAIRISDSWLMTQAANENKNIVYLILLLISLLVVTRILPYYVAVLIVLITVWITDRTVLRTVDYSLLFTFAAFFVFTGNMGEMKTVQEILQNFVTGRETVIGIVTSQVISNVPAALLLSGFTTDYKDLLIGVNLGGLGTLIASMASLISYKIYAKQYNEKKGKYLTWFTIANAGFLLILFAIYAFMHKYF